ncbi:MAG: VWA domain-containing protein [Thermoleophilia bacterium]
MSTRRVTETDLTRFYELFPEPDLARDLFNLVEGYRIDTRMRRTYPGIRRDMDAIHRMSAEHRPELLTLPDAQAVVEALLQRMIGMEPDLEGLAPFTRDLIGRAQAMVDAFPAFDAEVADTARCTADLYELISDAEPPRRPYAPDESPQDQQPPEQGEAPEPPAPEATGDGQDSYTPIELPPFMTQVMEELVRPPEQAPAQRKADAKERPDTPSEDAEEQMDGTMEATRPETGAGPSEDEVAQRSESPMDEEIPPGGASVDSPSPEESQGGGETPDQLGPDVPVTEESDLDPDLGEQTFHYDEWDYRIEDYRPAWCTLREQRATRTQEGFVAATFHEFGGIVTQIRRNFQLMRPDRLRKMRFQTEGDDLDSDGLVEYVVDKRTHTTPSGRVYIKRDKKDRDVTTAFLVDMSSSTDRKIDGRKRIIDIEKEALLLMCEALEAIRDEYAIYGFSGSGREDAQFYVVKELGERYDDRVKGRIGGIYARQKTRMGPALRHATRRLAAADSAVKLMILLTDGKPYDSDTYQDNTYAQEDTKIALREARREKIHLFCVTVDQEGADYLPHMYSDANFVVVDDVRTLPHKLPQLYRRLTS